MLLSEASRELLLDAVIVAVLVVGGLALTLATPRSRSARLAIVACYAAGLVLYAIATTPVPGLWSKLAADLVAVAIVGVVSAARANKP